MTSTMQAVAQTRRPTRHTRRAAEQDLMDRFQALVNNKKVPQGGAVNRFSAEMAAVRNTPWKEWTPIYDKLEAWVVQLETQA